MSPRCQNIYPLRYLFALVAGIVIIPHTIPVAELYETRKMVDMTLLETCELVKKYSGRAVVNKISITIAQRSIVGLLGRNGAGKTTTFRMIMGMITPNSGAVVFEGMDITKLPMYKRARLGIGYLSQEPSIFQRLTVRDNLYAILETMSITRAERNQKADMLIERFALSEVAESQGRFLSGGERRKLEIARAMVTDPSLILLDEPFSGVDPIAVGELQHELRRLVASGVSLLITDHNVERTLEVVDKAYIIDHGKVIGAGTSAEIVRNEIVRKHYLGNIFEGDEFDEKQA
jgi:lipopolysaccharide export system ATP-binding protein